MFIECTQACTLLDGPAQLGESTQGAAIALVPGDTAEIPRELYQPQDMTRIGPCLFPGLSNAWPGNTWNPQQNARYRGSWAELSGGPWSAPIPNE